MLKATTVSGHADLQEILDLQAANLKNNISNDEMKSEGFVTVHHSYDTIQKMHNVAPSVIIKDNEKIVAYALVMLKECRDLVPTLEPMFALLDQLRWKDKALNGFSFYVMGQICIAKTHRRQGLFEMLYQKHKEIYQHQFDFIITEVSLSNPRSLRAHERVGFETIHTYRDNTDDWTVIAWDWKNRNTLK